MAKLNVCILLALAVFAIAQQTDGPNSVPQAVTDYSSMRNTRYHHNFFHNVRMSYLNLDAVQQKALEKIGWAPPRPAKAYREGQEIVLTGDVGEDFLYMHRQMIAQVNAVSQQAGSSWRVVGWVNTPAPGDSVWPVPPSYTIPGNDALTGYINMLKTNDYYWNSIKPMEDWLEDPDNLRSLTLGELGVRLEFEIHTWLHLRFSGANSVGYRVQNANPTAEIDESWDAPAYNYLADFYSAHVNPYFWKIHGWIENKINAWQVANGVTRIQWIGTWEGGPMTDAILPELYAIAAASPNNPSDSSDMIDSSDVEVDRDTLEEVIKLLLHAAQD